MRFAVLGPIAVTADGRPIAIERRSHRRLLSILLLEAGRVLDSDVLIDRFWGEDAPRTARAALQTHVSQLRGRLGGEIIETAATGYVLRLEGHELDLAEFEAAAERSRGASRFGAWQDAADSARVSLALWRGTPFIELQDDEFAVPEIARLGELRAELIEGLAEALLAMGRNEEAVPDLERSAREFPYRERIWQQLMLARARLGRTVDALAAYHEARRLFDDVGLDPGPALRDLEERILREDPTLVPTSIRHNLPARRTSFVGRTRELAEVAGHLAHQRLVTLTGVGGSGKTRLAVETAAQLLERFPDGAFMVDLSAAADPDQVAAEAALALGLRPAGEPATTAVARAVRGRTLLLLVDNCEHLPAAVSAFVEAILGAGRGVTVLATSRAPLGVPGELVYAVEPLDVPASEDEPAAAVLSHAAVRLFTDRAAAVAPGFALTDENAQTVASLCRRLDGLPLAIELAAARMSALSPEDVADRLDNRFRILARSTPGSPARHQTLEAAVEWSYDHLTEAQRGLFARLAVFSGVFSLPMVEAVCVLPPIEAAEVAARLADLVERSLVVTVETPLGRRYRLLETIRHFARGKLVSLGEEALLVERHRDHFLRLAEARRGGIDSTWLESVKGLHDELEAACTWSIQAGHRGQAAILAAALGDYWEMLGHPGRGIGRLREALAIVDGGSEPERAADLHAALAFALHAAGDSDAAFGEAREAVRLVGERPASPEKVMALVVVSNLHRLLVRLDPADGVEPARRGLAVAESLGDPLALRIAHMNLGSALGWSGLIDEGLEHSRRALGIAAELAQPALILSTYSSLINQLWLHPEARRTEPPRIADEIVARFGAQPRLDESIPWGWIAYAFQMSGQWDRAEEAVERLAGLHPEGFLLTYLRHARGSLRWMQGRLDDAWADAVAAIESPDLSDRWYHDVYDLEGSIAAERGDLEGVRAAATRYLETEVHPAEAAMKSAVLRSLVRAEVDAALQAEGDGRAEHARLARDAQRRMVALVARHPPPSGGSVQLETAATNLQIAEAEISRLGPPRPELWEVVADQATFAYWKLYAAWRRAEALLDAGRVADGTATLARAREWATALGAAQIQRRLEDLAARHAAATLTSS